MSKTPTSIAGGGRTTQPRIDKRGRRFGKLTITCLDSKRSQHHRTYWLCACECGQSNISVADSNLHANGQGGTRSCGCLLAQRSHLVEGIPRTKHPLYPRHKQIRARCTDPTHHCYRHYGGRGIRLYEPWFDFGTFVAALPRCPGRYEDYEIDRIDNDSGYRPGNVRWLPKADRTVQLANRRGSRLYSLGCWRNKSLEWFARRFRVHPGDLKRQVVKRHQPLPQALRDLVAQAEFAHINLYSKSHGVSPSDKAHESLKTH